MRVFAKYTTMLVCKIPNQSYFVKHQQFQFLYYRINTVKGGKLLDQGCCYLIPR